MKLPEPECPRHPDGRFATKADNDLINEKLNHRPSELTPFDVEVTRYFCGDPGARLVEDRMKAAQSRQRREAMRVVERPPAPAPSTASSVPTLKQISRLISEDYGPRALRGKSFD